MSFGATPPIDQSLLPPDVRSAPPARQQAYTAALGFEQLLVQQLSQSLADSAQGTFDGTGDGGSDGEAGATNPYASLLPDALTQGVMNGGGLGLAAQLTDAIDPAQPSPAGGAAA
jgi:Rod binding domain-containing protein